LDDCSDDLPEDAASDEDAEDVPALCDEPEPPLKMAPKAAAALHEHVPLPKKKPKKPTAASAALHAHAPLPKKKPTAPLSTTATRKSSAAALTAFKKPASHLLREPLSALHCFQGSLSRWSEAALLAVKPARSAAVASRGDSHPAIRFSSEELKRLPDEQIISQQRPRPGPKTNCKLACIDRFLQSAGLVFCDKTIGQRSLWCSASDERWDAQNAGT
jgi:hypothetical protein